MPVKLTICGLPAALSVIVTAPISDPVAIGVNLTLIWQLDPAPSAYLHVVVREMGLLAVMTMDRSVAVPVLVIVTVCAALVVPTVCAANVKLFSERMRQ